MDLKNTYFLKRTYTFFERSFAIFEYRRISKWKIFPFFWKFRFLKLRTKREFSIVYRVHGFVFLYLRDIFENHFTLKPH